MARRSDHSKEELQTMAIDATLTILREEGFEGVSARKVAKDIGYTVGTLYQSFESIHDLILHANATTLSQLQLELEQALKNSQDSKQSLEKIALAYLNFAQGHENRWHSIFKSALPMNREIPHWYQHKIDALFYIVEEALRNLDHQHNSKDVQIAARTLWSSVHGICILHVGNKLFSVNIATPQQLIQSLVHNYLQSWLQQGSST